MFPLPCGIDVEPVPIDVQIEFIELQNDLDLKTKFLSKTFLEFYRASPKKKIYKDFKTCLNSFACLEILIIATNSFSKLKYCKSKYRNRSSDARLHDTFCIAATSMEPNVTTCNKRSSFVNHTEYMLPRKENMWQYTVQTCYVCCFSMHRTVQPADADKITNLAQHPKRLGTAGLRQKTLSAKCLSLKYGICAYIAHRLRCWFPHQGITHKSIFIDTLQSLRKFIKAQDMLFLNLWYPLYFYFVTDIDRCNPNPCLVGGICTSVPYDFNCNCPPFWTGKICNKRK